MTSTFLVAVDHGDDTDLTLIADDISETLSVNLPYPLVGPVRHWAKHTLPGAPVPQTPPDVSGT